MATVPRHVTEIERQVLELQPEIKRSAALAQAVVRLKRTYDDLAGQAALVETDLMRQHAAEIGGELEQLEGELAAIRRAIVHEPPMEDLRWSLPVRPGADLPRRSLSEIRRVVVHHTTSPEEVTPQRLAAAHLEQGKPSIAYHFLVARDGSLYYTQALDVAVSQAVDPQINREAVAVGLVGNFASRPPSDAQIAGAAALVAWLLDVFGLGPEAVVGRREVEDVSSPGAQWCEGARYGERLRQMVRTRREAGVARQAADGRASGARRAALSEGAAAPVGELAVGRVAKPAIVDIVDALPHHPTLPPYPKRTKPVSVIAIHHTDTGRNITPQQIAQYHVFGVKRDANGYLLKAQWPGIGYHFVITPNGTIYQCQREETRSYHVGGDPNDYCLGIALIGRFMRLTADGKAQAAEDQIPTAAQIRSTGQLVAWLMQELGVGIEKVMGHRDVRPRTTACPGEHWTAGLKWRELLNQAILAAQGCGSRQQIEHYLLFWDHGTAWARADWQNAQAYIAHFRPTAGFSVADALAARHVTIVGGPAGVSTADEARLRAAGVDVHRLNGANEAATAALLDQLVAKDTPWPGAPPRSGKATSEAAADTAAAEGSNQAGEPAPEVDEWTVPEDWEQWLAPPTEPWAVTPYEEPNR